MRDGVRPQGADSAQRGVDGGESEGLKAGDIRGVALRRFDETGQPLLPVVSRTEPPMVIGWAHQIDALERFSQELVEANREAHQ